MLFLILSKFTCHKKGTTRHYTDWTKHLSNRYKETTEVNLKWIHSAIRNARENFHDVYLKMKGKYLQNYLDAFGYKLNRRYLGRGRFDRIIIAKATNSLYTSKESVKF